MLTLLRRLLTPSNPRLDGLRVVVYTRDRCPCCQRAIDLLERYRARHGFTLESVDVDSDPALASRFGPSVPVVAFDGKVRFRGAVNPVLLDRLIAAGSATRLPAGSAIADLGSPSAGDVRDRGPHGD